MAIGGNGDIKPVYSRGSNIYQKINSWGSSCITVDYYGSVTVGGYEDIKYLGSETFCFGNGGGGGWNEDAPDLGDGGGGGGAGSGDYTSVYDCNGDLNGSAYTAECGCIGGNTGIVNCPPTIEVKQDSLKKYYPCMVKEILNKLLANSTYGKLIQPFQKIQLPNGSMLNSVQGLPNLTFGFSPQPYGGTSNNYALGSTQNLGGYSSNINLNTAAMMNASQLFLQIAAIHEVGHAYTNFYIKAGSYGYPVDTTRYSTWAMNIVNFESVAKSEITGGNFNDHSLFIENYVDNFISILKEINGTTYSDKEYQMAAIFGLNNAGERTYNYLGNGWDLYEVYKSKLEKSYSNLLSKYGITLEERDAFYQKNLTTVPENKKLPTDCP